VIYSVVSTTAEAQMQWQADLLEYSWGQVRQPGELVRLVAVGPGDPLPRHHHARVVETLKWCPHPYTGDFYPAYNTAGALLEWQTAEYVEGTILLIEPHCVFLSKVASEVEPGGAQGTPWVGLPRGDGPFGLGAEFRFLEAVCVDRTLPLQPVSLPVLIHSDDLRRITARWLELTSIIRAETAAGPQGPRSDAHRIAYVIAAAEADVVHSVTDLLGGTTDARGAGFPLLDYSKPIVSAHGGVAWDLDSYRAWEAVDPAQAGSGAGKSFLALLGDYVTRRQTGGDLALLRPCRRRGVREGRILDRLFLDIPGRSDTMTLNASAAAIWELCDGSHSLAEVAYRLEERFGMPQGGVRADVQTVVERLRSIGALELKPV
jgi:hypothetical protein